MGLADKLLDLTLMMAKEGLDVFEIELLCALCLRKDKVGECK